MILNAENVLKSIPNGLGEFGSLAQVGIDMSVKHITRIRGGKIYQGKKKAEIIEYGDVPYIFDKDENGKGVKCWKLGYGVYSLTFHQGVKIDNKHCGMVIGRSSTNRCAMLLRSGVFDPGFECEEAGATLYVFADGQVEIQEGARLGQLVLAECEEASEYNGSYQGDKDLK